MIVEFRRETLRLTLPFDTYIETHHGFGRYALKKHLDMGIGLRPWIFGTMTLGEVVSVRCELFVYLPATIETHLVTPPSELNTI